MVLETEKNEKAGQESLHILPSEYIFYTFSKCCIFIFLPDTLNIPERGKGRGNSLFKKIKKEKEAR